MTARSRIAGAAVVVIEMLALLVAAHPSPAAIPDHHIVMYAVTTRAQFINEADDIIRGDAVEPFNIDVKTIPPKPNGTGVLPGNSADFAFTVYSDPGLKKRVGTGSYTCRYGFKQRAICDAYFAVNGASLSASGLVDFTRSTFTLPMTGGTGRYVGVGGEVVSRPPTRPTAKNETVLDFVFVR
jgi:hypothetical protein